MLLFHSFFIFSTFTLNNTSGQNLDWLINPWFFEFGYLDLAIKSLSNDDEEYKIVIERKGKFPAAVHLKIVYVDGSEEILKENASVWMNGNNKYVIEKISIKSIDYVELLDPSLLDVDLSNSIKYFK